MPRKSLALALLVGVASPALACLWDYDTLQMERMRFPAALEIITGKFVRHSRAYYEWRIGDRKQKLEARPGDPALVDDLAVAYAKLGRPEEGIALLEPVLASHPDRYETISNLGTLLFFAGRLDESKQRIRRALEINPNAHFGRERFQLLLTEYLQQSQHQNLGVMSEDARYAPAGKPVGFARHVLAAKFGPAAGQSAIQLTPEQQAELSAATRGVLGMMHFADHQSPILLEALGDLLLTGQMEKNATQLAARAYLRAAQVTADPAVAARLRKMSEEAIASHIDFEEKGPGGREPKDLEAELAKEVAFGSAWFAAIESNEQRWIAEGRDVDREFAALYYDSLSKTVAAAERQLQSEPKDNRPSQNHQQVIGLVGAGAVCLGLPLVAIIVICGGIVWWRRRASHLHFPKGKQLPS